MIGVSKLFPILLQGKAVERKTKIWTLPKKSSILLLIFCILHQTQLIWQWIIKLSFGESSVFNAWQTLAYGQYITTSNGCLSYKNKILLEIKEKKHTTSETVLLGSTKVCELSSSSRNSRKKKTGKLKKKNNKYYLSMYVQQLNKYLVIHAT